MNTSEAGHWLEDFHGKTLKNISGVEGWQTPVKAKGGELMPHEVSFLRQNM